MIRFSPNPNRANLIRWHEWGDDAFAQAHAEDKPLMLFLTAFWCRFCQRRRVFRRREYRPVERLFHRRPRRRDTAT
jgi:L-lysine 2,3-aminomutase